MLDLVSTRAGVDEQTRRCARLLAYLVAQTVRTAAQPPDPLERDARINIQAEPWFAIEYLFSEDSAFGLHASLLGSNADSVRTALLGDAYLEDRSPFNPVMRKIIQQRHYWWTLAGKPPAPEFVRPKGI